MAYYLHVRDANGVDHKFLTTTTAPVNRPALAIYWANAIRYVYLVDKDDATYNSPITINSKWTGVRYCLSSSGTKPTNDDLIKHDYYGNTWIASSSGLSITSPGTLTINATGVKISTNSLKNPGTSDALTLKKNDSLYFTCYFSLSKQRTTHNIFEIRDHLKNAIFRLSIQSSGQEICVDSYSTTKIIDESFNFELNKAYFVRVGYNGSKIQLYLNPSNINTTVSMDEITSEVTIGDCYVGNRVSATSSGIQGTLHNAKIEKNNQDVALFNWGAFGSWQDYATY